MTRKTITTLFLCAVWAADAQDAEWLKAMATKSVVYQVPGMDRVKVARDIAYKNVESGSLLCDIYTAENSQQAGPRPGVILIHGGPVPRSPETSPKNWEPFQSWGRLVAASGLSAIAFNHRLYGVKQIRDAVADLQDLMKYLQEHAESLGIQTDHLCLFAFSSGGALLSPYFRETPGFVRCVVAYYAALDTPNTEFSAANQLMQNTGRIPPMFLARAGLDTPMWNGFMQRVLQIGMLKNAPIEFMNHPAGHHGFDVVDDNDRSREIIRRTIEFLQTQLK